MALAWDGRIGRIIVKQAPGLPKGPGGFVRDSQPFFIGDRLRSDWVIDITGIRTKPDRSDCAILKMMTALYPDTCPEMEALQIRLLRQTPAWRKLKMLAQLNASAHLLALSGLRQRYPAARESELRRRLADLLLGDELARKAYGELQDVT